MNPIRILLPTFLFSLHASACLWVDGTTIDGKVGRIPGDYPSDILRISMEKLPEDRIDDPLFGKFKSPRDEHTARETEAVRMIFGGNYGEAIAILHEIEAQQPGRYSTAVNLGTAYELQGNLEQALKWITEGIHRNPQSHYGTEWLHVEILKTKIKLKEDPTYLQNNHVIELPDGFTRTSQLEIGGRSLVMKEVAESILYQLRERMVFVKPQDPVVADLLFTYGQAEATNRIVESGMKLFDLANEYGYLHPDQIAAKMALYEQASRDRERMLRIRKIVWKIVGVWTVVAFFIFVIVAWKKRWCVLSRGERN